MSATLSTESPCFSIHSSRSLQAEPSSVASIILGGGQGTRLFPLTQSCCKPALLLGGRYRLIDVPISNSLNSGINKIFVLTQFLSRPLHRHLFNSFKHHTLSSGFIEVLSAEQRPGKSDWFQGTADAVRQNIEYLKETSAEFFLILSGDQLYHLDFEKFAACTAQKDVDVWVATLAVNATDATRMGIMKVDNSKHIVDFCEKPSFEQLQTLKTAPATLAALGAESDDKKEFLGSMGIYLFRRSALLKLLAQDTREDFGKHLIPTQVKQGRIAAFVHNGYWEDIGTVDSFYHANLALNHQNPSFVCHSEYHPMCSTPSHLPAPRFFNTNIHASTICEGAVIDQAYISNSIIGQRTIVKKGTSICDSYFMGNDYYEPLESLAPTIGEDCTIHRAILDQNVRIGNRVSLTNKQNLQHYDGPSVFIRDGIIVVPKGAHIPDDFVL